MDPTLQTLLVAGLALIAVLIGGFALIGSGGDRAKKRIEQIAARDPRTNRSPLRDKEKERRKIVLETLKEVELKQKEQRAKRNLKYKIDQAGLTISPLYFHLVCLGLAAILGLVAFVFHVKFYVIPLISFAGGLGVPRWVLGFLCGRRRKAFSAEFANAIDVIVRGVRSGLPLNECLQIIARESQSPLKEEFQQIVDGQKMGLTLEQSLSRLYEAMPIAEVNFFAIVLTVQQKTGGNLSEALGNLSSVLRGRKTLKGKIAAFSSEAKASAMIIGSLPPMVMIMVYLSTPSYISLLWTERLGQIMLMGGVLWMASGIFVMRKMINFNY